MARFSNETQYGKNIYAMKMILWQNRLWTFYQTNWLLATNFITRTIKIWIRFWLEMKEAILRALGLTISLWAL